MAPADAVAVPIDTYVVFHDAEPCLAAVRCRLNVETASPEGLGHGRHRPLVHAVHPVDGAEVDIVVPRDEGAIADGAEAGPLSQEEHNSQLVEDLLGLPEEGSCHGGVHRRDGPHQPVNLRPPGGVRLTHRAPSSAASRRCQPGARVPGLIGHREPVHTHLSISASPISHGPPGSSGIPKKRLTSEYSLE